ncbi:hypothetical protein BB561_005048 [Smittium simulii]|uniref:Cation-transporting P-type ATPase N-terminal domain-containing protein n=1 Tax=Smittium simulii TaxID=133385 RepID=A0A2T9YCL6_9FUNG|nr:hypothetical protein BB561_005048 [Smittium simulii]
MKLKHVDNSDKSEKSQHHTLSFKQVALNLETNLLKGLEDISIAERTKQYGLNELKIKKTTNPWKILFRQFANLMVIILIGAAVLSFTIKNIGEGLILIIIVVANSTVGFFQEFKAEKTVESLRKLTSPNTKVLRNEANIIIPTIELVPGDIILLESGDIVGADCRLFDICYLEIDEALLTGEALPAVKCSEVIPYTDCPIGDRANTAYSGTLVTKGKAKGIVYATGMCSEVGKIASKLSKPKESRKSSLVKSLENLSYCCLIAAIICVLIIFGVNKFKINGEIVIYAISLAIAVIPEGLLAVLTFTMALGVRKMSEQKALVRQLNILEVLGSVTDICSDKTGTLTQSKMVLVSAWTSEDGYFSVSGLGFEPIGDIYKEPMLENSENEISETNSSDSDNILTREHFSSAFIRLIESASLCNSSDLKQDKDSGEYYGTGDPTDIALQVFSSKAGFSKQRLIEESWVVECEFSFDSTIKLMSVIAKNINAGRFVFIKGATEKVILSCDRVLVDNQIKTISDCNYFSQIDLQVNKMASKGLRVISLAYREVGADEFQGDVELWDRKDAEKNMIYIGMVGIYDPPRPESKDSVRRCFKAGINVRMLTGDHLETAKAIAKKVGIIPDNEQENSVNSKEMIKINSLVMTASHFDSLTDAEVDSLEEIPAVIARCSPETKLKLIKALHRRNKIVAMTGDGVNDSLSLKHSDVGIAMGITGSDVAKQASSIILTDDNFSTIVAAVSEGRVLFTNIGKFIRCLVGTNVAGTVCLMLCLIFRDVNGNSVFPLSPVAILVNNLVTRAPPAMALGTEEAPENNMTKEPRSVKSESKPFHYGD